MAEKMTKLTEEELENVVGGNIGENQVLSMYIRLWDDNYKIGSDKDFAFAKSLIAQAFNVSPDKVELNLDAGNENNSYIIDGKSYEHRAVLDALIALRKMSRRT